MPRRAFNHWKASLLFLSGFFLTFSLGLFYWQLILSNHCSSIQTTLPYQTILDDSQSFYQHFQYRTIQTCRNKRSNIFLTIAVLSSYERLVDYLPAMLETWILTATVEIEIIVFLEEKSLIGEEFLERLFANSEQRIPACLFIVKLKHVENDYPPQKKSFYAMKFIHTYYQRRTSWVLRLDDNAYVNVPQLVQWLKSIDHRQALYIGQGGTGRQNGPAIHFPPGKYFCMGGSGVILSQETLVQLGPWLNQCYQSELLTKHEDVELGRCILNHLQIGCTTAYNSKVLFYHHYGPRYSFGYDFTPAILSQAFIVHPIANRTTFRQIFSFYQRKHQPRKSHSIRSSARNRIPYVTFGNSMEFDLVRDIHYQLIDARWKAYIDRTVQSYIQQLQRLWYQRSSNWTIINGKFLFGYHRVIPNDGLELIVEVLLNLRAVSNSSARPVVVRKRFHLRQPFVRKQRFDYREIDHLDNREDRSRLNLIVVSSNKDEALTRFIHNYQEEILAYPDREDQFPLTILYFLRNNSLIDHLRSFAVRYASVVRLIIINETEHEYNRGYGRQYASKYFTNDQLLFFLDVDILFTGQSLINTRRLIIHQLSVSSCAVYFPIIYSAFSRMFKVENRPMMDVRTDAGLFSIYGFGNVAVRKGDLERIGGWEKNNRDWGVEDGNLFERFVNLSADCSVFRTVEPGLRHYYHKKMCEGIENPRRQKMCDEAELNLLGSQIDMMNYLFDHRILNDDD